MRMLRCAFCRTPRLPGDLHAFTGATTQGYVCRPDRWMDEKGPGGEVLRRGLQHTFPRGHMPCFSHLTSQRIAAVVTTHHTREFSSYPIRPGTSDWDRLMEANGLGDRDGQEDAPN